jgi:cytochrome c oxidase subunit 4
MGAQIHTNKEGHPTPQKYVIIAAILAVITMAEVAIVYFNLATAFLITILIIMSTVKFSMVAMFFMHLKFDNKLFSYLFFGGVVLTIGVILALIAIFKSAGS